MKNKQCETCKNYESKNDITQLVYIIDRSGSMSNLVPDVIGGFNTFIDEQKELGDNATLTTILFDNEYEVLHDNINISKINHITNKEYSARGTTALIDAIGKTINNVANSIEKSDDKPNRVLVVIMTDGHENASKEYSLEQVKKMVDDKTKQDWEFLFLGANIDSYNVGSGFGFNPNYTANFVASGQSVSAAYSATSSMSACYRKGKTMNNLEDIKDGE